MSSGQRPRLGRDEAGSTSEVDDLQMYNTVLCATCLYCYVPQMANDEGRKQQEEDDEVTNVTPNGKLTREQRSSKGSVSETEEEEEEEPRLKYASLTNHLKPVYRNGDATSTFLVAGDKMVRLTWEVTGSPRLTSCIGSWYTQWLYRKLGGS